MLRKHSSDTWQYLVLFSLGVSNLSSGEVFFFKFSTAFTCVEEDIFESLSWLISIFSTLDKGIVASTVHIGWGSA
eukprot:IDg22492t1